MSQEVGSGSTKLGFRRRKLEVVFPKAFKKGADVGDVNRGVEVENYDVVKVGGYAVKVFDDLVDDLDEPARRGAASLRHDEAIEESGGRAEGSQRYSVLVDGDLMERRHESEQGEDAVLPTTPFVKVLVRWAKGKRLTDRVSNLSLITLSSPGTDRIIYGSTRDTNTRFQLLGIQKYFFPDS